MSGILTPMAEYIDFKTTINSRAVNFMDGSPVHDGVIPAPNKEIEAVRIDGEPINFVDPETPDTLHRALVEGRVVSERGYIYDALVFVALMSSVDLVAVAKKHRISRKPRDLDIQLKLGDKPNLDQALPADSPVALYSHYVDEESHRRTLVHPVHTPACELYVSRMSDTGPIVLASLDAFKRGYKAYITIPVEHIGLK